MKTVMRGLLLLIVALAWIPLNSLAGVFVSVGFAPPPLPIYEQPLCPGPGYLWTPGYWAYDEDDGYYWVPGTWVLAPEPGLLWTPGYWGWSAGLYLWNAGYWGPHVGFYGGVDYGFGYNGVGYQGGYWNRGEFNYNRSVNNINVTNIHNSYNSTVVNNTNTNRVSYNGGQGGTTARPSGYEHRAANDPHFQPTGSQVQHQQAARGDPSQRYSANNGHPGVFATARPGLFHGQGAVTRGTAIDRPTQAAAQNRGAQPWAGQRMQGSSYTQRPASLSNRTAVQNNQPRYQYQPRESQPGQQTRSAQLPQGGQSWARGGYGQQQIQRPQYRQDGSQPRYAQGSAQSYQSSWSRPSYGQQNQFRSSYAQPRYAQTPAWQGRAQQFSHPQFQPQRAPQFSQARPQAQPHWGGVGGGGWAHRR